MFTSKSVYGLLYVMLVSACGGDESSVGSGWAERESGEDDLLADEPVQPIIYEQSGCMVDN
ncbi:MAG: hypothetical protein KTR25_21190 [Myxococcales bacterium]|nr:hypothetical protein [Myxococcales bacterium]